MEKTVELLMKNASLLDVELVAGVLKQEGIPHFIKEKGPGGIYSVSYTHLTLPTIA